MRTLKMAFMIRKITKGCPKGSLDGLTLAEAKKVLEYLRLNAKILNQYLRLKDNDKLRDKLESIYKYMVKVKDRIRRLKLLERSRKYQ